MSNLSFIPSATASKPAQDYQQPTFSEKNFGSGANSFDQFLKSANEEQFKTKPLREKSEQSRPVDTKVKSRPEKDQVKSDAQPRPDKVESQSKPDQKVVADSETKEASQPQTLSSADEKVATKVPNEENQNKETPVAVNQDELLALLAHLAEAEAVIRGETQPETVQMAELAKILADSESVEKVQIAAVSGGSILEGAKTVKTNSEIPVINAEVNGETVKLETATEGKITDLGQLNQTLPQASANSAQSEGEFLFNQGQNPDAKGQISEAVKVTQNANLTVEDESQFVNKVTFGANSVSPKVEADLQPKDRVLASDQSAAKSGRVDLAVIQTHLAVNDAPDVKTDLPTINVIPGQPSINNLAQPQTTGSAGVNPANKEELFSQLVEHAKVMINNGGSEMEINLKPEHLGKLQLKVTIENEVVTARFVAESQQVKEIIESSLGQLKRNLQENGMQVDTIMVSVGNHQSNDGFEQAAYNQEGSNSFKGSSEMTNDDFASETENQSSLAQSDTVIDLIA